MHTHRLFMAGFERIGFVGISQRLGCVATVSGRGDFFVPGGVAASAWTKMSQKAAENLCIKKSRAPLWNTGFFSLQRVFSLAAHPR